MDDWLSDEFCFYFNELYKTMEEVIEEYADTLMSNLHNKDFCPDQTRNAVLTKYFPEVLHIKPTLD